MAPIKWTYNLTFLGITQTWPYRAVSFGVTLSLAAFQGPFGAGKEAIELLLGLELSLNLNTHDWNWNCDKPYDWGLETLTGKTFVKNKLFLEGRKFASKEKVKSKLDLDLGVCHYLYCMPY